MSSSDPAQSGIKEAEVRLWFTRWLTDKQADVNPGDLFAAEGIKLEAALTSADIQISKKVEKTVLSQLHAGESSRVFTCSGDAATSFLDGTVNIGQTGNNSFVHCPRILIDTGVLVPSGIAISDVFFKDHLGGDISRLKSRLTGRLTMRR